MKTMDTGKMTLDEAIAHAREIASKKYAEGMLCHANPNDEELDKCIECAREHEQLAVWLEDLKKYRQIGTVNECYGYKIHSQGIRTLNDCNNCGRKRNCTIKPRYGEYCRINCYLWEEDQNEPKS